MQFPGHQLSPPADPGRQPKNARRIDGIIAHGTSARFGRDPSVKCKLGLGLSSNCRQMLLDHHLGDAMADGGRLIVVGHVLRDVRTFHQQRDFLR